MHVDPGNEVRIVSGLFHGASRGTAWSMGPRRDLVVPVNAGAGIGDWDVDEEGEVVFSYHFFLYGDSGKSIGYALTGTMTLRFLDLAGRPLALPMGPFGMQVSGRAGPFRAEKAATPAFAR